MFHQFGQYFKSTVSICGVAIDSPNLLSTDKSLGIRPVLHLALSVKIKNDGGDGTSTNPFLLE